MEPSLKFIIFLRWLFMLYITFWLNIYSQEIFYNFYIDFSIDPQSYQYDHNIRV